MWVETSKDWNGRYFIAWQPGSSRHFRCRKGLTAWLKWPKGTPTRASLDSWLDSLEADQRAPVEEPLAAADGLDPSDPQFQTRTVI